MCRLSSCGSRAQLLRGMWDLPRPGLEPVSPAFAGRLSTTAPPGKPGNYFLTFITTDVLPVLGLHRNGKISSMHSFVTDFFSFNKFIYFIYLFLAALGLRCCARAFSSCCAWASHCGGFSCCGERALGTRAQQLWLAGSRMQAQQLWRTGLVALRHVGSSRTRARTCVPCIGRWILNHCATREAPFF